MSIQTSAKPENTKIRTKKTPSMIDSSNSVKSNAPVEVEVSIPALIMIIVGLVSAIWGGVYFYNKAKANDPVIVELPSTLGESLVDVSVPLENILLSGSEDAEYVFIEYSDFECPFCKMHATGIDPRTGIKTKSTNASITEKYIDTGIARYGFVPFIGIESHKPAATNESVGLYCAEKQNLTLDYLDSVFTKTLANGLGIDQKGTEEESMYELIKEINGDVEAFTSCYKERDIVHLDVVAQDADKNVRIPWTNKFGEQNFGTPFFVVCKVSEKDSSVCNGSAFVGAWPFENMEEVLDKAMGIPLEEEN